MTFQSLGLNPQILRALDEKGYSTPSPIQAKAIPAVISGGDLMAAAQTGTGKTAGFTLPLLERLIGGEKAKPNQARVLVLTPTRELAAQVLESVETYGKHLPLKYNVVFGGVKINPQMMALRKGTDILVATPGRLLDLYNQRAIRFDHLETLVLDEADRMLDMGFIHDIKKIIKVLPKERQNLLFSATFSDDIRKLARGFLKDPAEISVSPPNSTVEAIKQWLIPVDKGQKTQLLIHMIKEHNWSQVLVFSRTKHGANKLVKIILKAGIESAAIHGNKSQGARTAALAGFKKGKVQVLVATDIAARGIDIDELPHVVNFDLPNVPEDYVHRIGRTGRAGSSGVAVSLVSADEHKQLLDIEKLLKRAIVREYESGFEPDHELPASRLSQSGPASNNSGHVNKPKKPNKPRSPNRSSQPRPAKDNAANPKTNERRSTSDRTQSARDRVAGSDGKESEKKSGSSSRWWSKK